METRTAEQIVAEARETTTDRHEAALIAALAAAGLDLEQIRRVGSAYRTGLARATAASSVAEGMAIALVWATLDVTGRGPFRRLGLSGKTPAAAAWDLALADEEA